jgi:hypothetical protein
MEGTYLMAVRCPVYRRHDSYPGFRTELENGVGDANRKGTSRGTHEAESTDALIRGALLRKSNETG